MKCKDCKCFQDNKGKQTGECRKYAPRTIIAGCGVGEVPEYSNDWAIVKIDDWCGEFEAKE